MFDRGHAEAQTPERGHPEQTADNDRAVVADLVAWIKTGNGAAEARVFRLFGQSPPAFRTRLLDGLANAAAGDCPYALTVLVAIVSEYHLTRPAIASVGLTDADMADAEQATLIALTRSIHGFQGQSRFSTWLHRVARNTAVSEVRRQKPTVGLDRLDLQPNEGPSQRRLSSLVAESHMVESVIACLPEAFRTTVYLRDLERLSYQEIADKQGISINTVKSRLNRGRQLLASEWNDQVVEAVENPQP